ncbi:MAG: hypothetical protein QOK19_463 [Solirubrobacteraceae bacterium]|jgi:CDGSH-type Zn-finger protein|nr:hypothetical protein [Solirubrobacteraceae bacterium]
MTDSPLDIPATITAYQDGPYLIRGSFRLVDQQGGEIELQRRTIALCRCGKSRIRPFCDGTHRSIGFQAPSGPEDRHAAGETEPLTDGTVRPASGDGAARDQPGNDSETSAGGMTDVPSRPCGQDAG